MGTDNAKSSEETDTKACLIMPATNAQPSLVLRPLEDAYRTGTTNDAEYQCSVCGARGPFSNRQRKRAEMGDAAKCTACSANAVAESLEPSLADTGSRGSAPDNDQPKANESDTGNKDKPTTSNNNCNDSQEQTPGLSNTLTAAAILEAAEKKAEAVSQSTAVAKMSIPRKTKSHGNDRRSSLLDHVPKPKPKGTSGRALWSKDDEDMMQELRSDDDDSHTDNDGDHGHVSLNVLKQKIMGRKIITDEDVLEEEEEQQQQRLLQSPKQQYNLQKPSDQSWVVPPELRKELLCAICHDPLYQPVSLHCGHSFCGTCLHWWMQHYRKEQHDNNPRNNETNMVQQEGHCPTCRRSIFLQHGAGSLGVNTALRACVTALLGDNYQRKRQAEEKAQQRQATKGEHGGAHARGFQELTSPVEHGWRVLDGIPKWNQHFWKGRRSIVLDADDQRMQLALSLWAGNQVFVDRQRRRHSTPPVRFDQEGILHLSICLLSMEEDEAADGPGFPIVVKEEDDDEHFVCSHESRWVHSLVEATALVTPERNDDGETVQPVPVARKGFESAGVVEFEISFENSPEIQRASMIQFKHLESGAVLEIQLPEMVQQQQQQQQREHSSAAALELNDQDHGGELDLDGQQLVEEDEDDEDAVGAEFSDEGDEADEEDLCAVCRQHGELMICDGGDYLEGCGRSFHIGCVNRSVVPDGDWVCEACANENPEALVDFEGEVGIEGYEFPRVDEDHEDENVDHHDQDEDDLDNMPRRRRKRILPGAMDLADDSDDGDFGSSDQPAAAKGRSHIEDDEDSDGSLQALPANNCGEKPSKRICVVDSDEDDE